MPEHEERSSRRQALPDHGSTPPTVGFSNDPHPSVATGLAGLYGNKALAPRCRTVGVIPPIQGA